jgi:hypothetical protein
MEVVNSLESITGSSTFNVDVPKIVESSAPVSLESNNIAPEEIVSNQTDQAASNVPKSKSAVPQKQERSTVSFHQQFTVNNSVI